MLPFTITVKYKDMIARLAARVGHETRAHKTFVNAHGSAELANSASFFVEHADRARQIVKM